MPKGSQARNIGLVSTRFSETDGVSLETAKWVAVLERLGHRCFYFAGAADYLEGQARVVPEADFRHPDIAEIHEVVFSQAKRPVTITRRIRDLAECLKNQVAAFTREFEIDLLIVENALSLPMNIPLGLALTEFIAESGMQTIGHHHDFYWERPRYLNNCVEDYMAMAFPPRLPSMQHVVINSDAARQLSLRVGVAPTVIPNVMDFANPPASPDRYAASVRQAFGLEPGQWLVLQPTRIIERKQIEQALELARRLGPRARLVVSHAAGDEGLEYLRYLTELSELLKVPVRFIADKVDVRRGRTPDGRPVFTLQDIYQAADIVTYPSSLEGFGNAFLEAIYYSRPLVLNTYSIYELDIKPRGFKVIEFEGFVRDHTIEQVRAVLDNAELAKEMTAHNYRLAERFYSYEVLEIGLQALLTRHFGEEPD